MYSISEHAQTTIEERHISLDWIDATMREPALVVKHPEDATLTEVLRAIPEYGNRVLRIIYNHDKTPPHIVTAYFDRTMKGKV